MNMSELLRGTPFERNPLSTIGITPEVLGLGLSDEELHRHCLRVARDLFAMFHTDATADLTTEQLEMQTRFSEAFNQLKDRTVFERALHDLRGKKSEARADINEMRRDMSDLLQRSKEQEAKLMFCQREHGNQQAQLNALFQRFTNYINGIGKRARFGKSGRPGTAPLTQVQELLFLGMYARHARDNARNYYFNDSAIRAEKKRYEQLVQLGLTEQRRTALIRDIRSRGLTSLPLTHIDSYVRAFKMQFPAVEWSEDIAFAQYGLRLLCEGQVRRVIEAQDLPTQYLPRKDELEAKYLKTLGQASAVLNKACPYVSDLRLKLGVTPHYPTCIGADGATYGICGTIPIEEFSSLNLTVAGEVRLGTEEVLHRLEPIVTEGALLIGTTHAKLTRVPASATSARERLLESFKTFPRPKVERDPALQRILDSVKDLAPNNFVALGVVMDISI